MQGHSDGFQLVESKVANVFQCEPTLGVSTARVATAALQKKAFGVSFWKSRNRLKAHREDAAPLPSNNKTDVDK
jgi:hypothetical protein